MQRYYKSKKTRKPAGEKGAAVLTTSAPQQKGKQPKKAQQSAETEEEALVTQLPQDDPVEVPKSQSSKQKPKQPSKQTSVETEALQEEEEEKENQSDNVVVPSSTTQVIDAVRTTYDVLQKATGALGGNGYQGAIYGELTMGSMQRVIDILKTKCEMDKNSCFIDVGSGLGKPSFHAAQDPAVALSFGVELEEIRWQLAMHNLNTFLNTAKADDDAGRQLVTRVNFMCGDIDNVDTFDPFTHVYMYDLGFPPPLQKSIARKFNNSTRAVYLISYRTPRRVTKEYGYNVTLIDKCATSMHGSSEGHTAYFYKKILPATASTTSKAAEPEASTSSTTAAATSSSSRASSPEQTRTAPREVSTPQRSRRGKGEEPAPEVFGTPTASRRRLASEVTTSPAARRHQGVTVDIPTADGQTVTVPCAMAWKDLVQLAVGPLDALAGYAQTQVDNYLNSGRPRRNSRRVRLFDA